ncbi:hypothetical protein SAMN06296952_1526 [Oscillospiraceae bacterium]|nr:hypothetical protein SAMN06296952_1526 [Oscillospiraceae bacterium]
MKIMVASDIHGSIGWAGRIIEKYKETGADKLLLLGDLLYHGPRNDLPSDYAPKEVIALLNEYKKDILAVRGNCDTEVDQMVLEFPIMAEYIYVTSGDLTIFATHGHHHSDTNPPVFLPEGAILMTGHTHVACDVIKDGFRYMNPGSPSIPKNGTMPSYILVEDGKAELIAF